MYEAFLQDLTAACLTGNGGGGLGPGMMPGAACQLQELIREEVWPALSCLSVDLVLASGVEGGGEKAVERGWREAWNFELRTSPRRRTPWRKAGGKLAFLGSSSSPR